MAPKPKPTPHRLGPPPQLNTLKIPVVQQRFAKKVQPKLREVVSRHIKILAKWFHTQFSWKKFLLFWMVMLIASKMVLLMLTYEFFSLTSLVSLEVGIFKIEFSGKLSWELFAFLWSSVMLPTMTPILWQTDLDLQTTKNVTEVLLWVYKQRVKEREICPTCFTAVREGRKSQDQILLFLSGLWTTVDIEPVRLYNAQHYICHRNVLYPLTSH